MPSFASVVPGEEGGTVSPRLAIAIVGCMLAFLAIIIGFLLVARKERRSASSPLSSQSLPLTNNHYDCPNLRAPARRSMALPVASLSKCPTCLTPSGKGFRVEGSSVSHDSPSPQPEAPLPRYTRYAPTGTSAIRPDIWRSASSTAATSTIPTTPPSPPPAYVGRGPTARFRRAVY